MVLLRLLAERESYGYELVTRLHDLGLTDVVEGTVYPALSRLERDELLTSKLRASKAGPARRYYLPSPKGRRLLGELEASWTSLVDVLHPVVSQPLAVPPKEAS